MTSLTLEFLCLGRVRRCRSRIGWRWPVIAVTLALLVAGCQTSERKPPPPPPQPQIVKVVPAAPPQPTTREALPPPDQLALAGPNYDAERAQALRRGPAAPPPHPGVVRVCLLVPMSGNDARVGTAMWRASLLSLFENAGNNLELLPYDTAGRSDQTSRSTQLALADGCALFLGPLLAADVQTAAPIAAEHNVPVIAFSSDRKVSGNNVFVLGLTPQTQVERIVRYAAAQGRRKLAILTPNDAYGATVVETAKALAPELQMAVVAVEQYAPSTTDFAEVLRRLPGAGAPAATPLPTSAASTASPFDALLIADGGARLKAIASQLAANGIAAPQVQILGTGLWDEPGLGAEEALVGAWYAAPDPAFRRDFENTYRAIYGAQPHRLATLAYDATAMAALLAIDVGTNGTFSLAALTDPSGFFGRDGLFRLNPDGLTDRRLAVLQVEPRQVTIISAPDTSFAGS